MRARGGGGGEAFADAQAAQFALVIGFGEEGFEVGDVAVPERLRSTVTLASRRAWYQSDASMASRVNSARISGMLEVLALDTGRRP